MRVWWSGDILYGEKPWEKGYNGVQNVVSLPYFGLVNNNGALGITIVVVAFRNTTEIAVIVISTYILCVALSLIVKTPRALIVKYRYVTTI